MILGLCRLQQVRHEPGEQASTSQGNRHNQGCDEVAGRAAEQSKNCAYQSHVEVDVQRTCETLPCDDISKYDDAQHNQNDGGEGCEEPAPTGARQKREESDRQTRLGRYPHTSKGASRQPLRSEQHGVDEHPRDQGP